jgi:hypothetical protein
MAITTMDAKAPDAVCRGASMLASSLNIASPTLAGYSSGYNS